MTTPIQISDAAREAAKRMKDELPGSLFHVSVEHLAANFQLAIDAAVAERDKEIERLKKDFDIQRQNYLLLHDAVLGEGCTTADWKDINAIATQHRQDCGMPQKVVEALENIKGGFYPPNLIGTEKLMQAAESPEALAALRDEWICWLQAQARAALQLLTGKDK